MHDPPQRQRFREELRDLIAKKSAGEASASVSREEVEDVGASLGMKSDEACQEFLAVYGELWMSRAGSLAASRVETEESSTYPPPRNWSSFDDVVLA